MVAANRHAIGPASSADHAENAERAGKALVLDEDDPVAKGAFR